MPANRQVALKKDRRAAGFYARAVARRSERDRRRVIGLLRLRPGAVVFDVGCGTGLSFPLIEKAIGPGGRIVGIDQSGEMLGEGREEVGASGWQNVTLIEAPVEEADIGDEADAVLLCFTHDILQTRRALENVFRPVKAEARAG